MQSRLCNSWRMPVLVILTVVTILVTPHAHSLLLTAAAAFAVCVNAQYRLKAGSRSWKGYVSHRQCFLAGALLGLAAVCARAAAFTATTRWVQSLYPLALTAVPSLVSGLDLSSQQQSFSLVCTSGVAALAAFRVPYDNIQAISLALCQGISTILAFILLQQVSREQNAYSDRFLPVEKFAFVPSATTDDTVIRDTALGLLVSSGIASRLFEFWPVDEYLNHGILASCLCIAILAAFQLHLTICTALQQDASMISAVFSAAALGAEVLSHPTTRTIAFSGLASAALSASFFESIKTRNAQLYRLSIFLAAILFFGILAIDHVTSNYTSAIHTFEGNFNKAVTRGPEPNNAIQFTRTDIHPVKQLIDLAGSEWDHTRRSQSLTFEQAVLEYRRRYGMSPPPLFDTWYEFAKRNEVQMIDEYDTIYHSLLPFWALRPNMLRQRVREAIGYDGNGLIALLIRKGQPLTITGGDQWQRDALLGLIEPFAHLLPDIDLAFNMHDEPRIVVPQDELSQMVDIGRLLASKSLRNSTLVNKFSSTPTDMAYSDIMESQTSRFNEYSHQNTWIPSRLSCHPSSPARDFSEEAPDSMQEYAITSLGFVYNQTAATDICLTPSLKSTHGFFDRPNAFKVAHDLIPIFSESKVSSFQDILFPSMWHFNRALPTNRTSDMHMPGRSKPMYDEGDDMPWEEKEEALWWRGSTTGGFSRAGAWRRHHRQRIVRELNSNSGTAWVLDKPHLTAAGNTTSLNPSTSSWRPTPIPRSALTSLINVRFSGVGQCDPGDCRAQEEFFAPIDPYGPMARAWSFRHVLDIDGNAFSARFYALLRSRSLVHKAAIFREWHDEWIRPWVHYVPLGVAHTTDHAECLRYFAREDEGRVYAKRIAEQSREWAGRALRREDMQVWMFRLLLEYARVVDDAREDIGYSG